MEQFGLTLITIILIALGIAFVFAELESDEAEFFGPAAIFCLIMGIALWFISNPASWLISPEWFGIISIMLITVVLILISFSILLTYKMIILKKNPTNIFEFVGGIGKTIDEIGEEKKGYIQFHGEYWKAYSERIVKPGQRVRILKKEGLTLFVEPEENLFCSNCGAKLSFDSDFCSNCGTHVKN